MTRVALLGTGTMGPGMAHALLRAGHDVTVWNRTREHAEPLASEGAHVAKRPNDAVREAVVVITMLTDGEATAAVMRDCISAVPDGAVWAQMGTIGIEATERLAQLAEDNGVTFVDAPVSGSKAQAENGELIILAAGPLPAFEKCAPVFNAIGKATKWVSERPGDGMRLKLVVNEWLLGVLVALGEAIAFTRSLGLDPELFLDAIHGGPLDSPYARLKGKAMIEGDYTPSFAAKHALKDAGLMQDAARRVGCGLPVTDLAATLLRKTVEAGHGDEDVSVVYEAQRCETR